MPFLRFTRDKRGYEHFALVHPTTNRRGKVRTRVLYWYRTPPDVKVGREPFDESMRRALEAQNPGVVFDWKKIIETPIPSAETERWRERRRQEKAEKAARRAEAAAEAAAGQPVSDTVSDTTDDLNADEADLSAEQAEEAPVSDTPSEAGQALMNSSSPAVEQTPGGPGHRRRRRRRRGRRGQGSAPAQPDAGAQAAAAAADTGEPAESDPPAE